MYLLCYTNENIYLYMFIREFKLYIYTINTLVYIDTIPVSHMNENVITLLCNTVI